MTGELKRFSVQSTILFECVYYREKQMDVVSISTAKGNRHVAVKPGK